MEKLIRFQGNHPEPIVYPMTSVPTVASSIVSPRVGKDNGVPAPTMPEDGAPFYDELFEVANVTSDVCKGKWPGWLFEKHGVSPDVPEPLRLNGVSIKEPKTAGEYVHGDLPGDLGRHLFRWIQTQDCPLKVKPNHLGTPFVETFPYFEKVLSANIDYALNKAFEVKWYYGRPRPSEVLGFNLSQYPEGDPGHGAYIAGHSAIFGATYYTFQQLFALKQQLDLVIETSSLHAAMYRELAGVHYHSDNYQGWLAAQRWLMERDA